MASTAVDEDIRLGLICRYRPSLHNLNPPTGVGPLLRSSGGALLSRHPVR